MVGVVLVLAVGVVALSLGGVAAAGQSPPAEGSHTPDSAVATGVPTEGSVVVGAGDGGAVLADGPSGAGNLTTQALFDVTILDTTAPVEGAPVVVTVEVSNTGAAGEQVVVAEAGPLGDASTTVTLGAGASETVELSIDTTADGDTGDAADSPYALTVTSGDDVASTAVEVGLPAVGSAGSPAKDLNGDSLYEDVDGDGSIDIFDVQTLFNELEAPGVQNHAWAFDFNGDSLATIFDVQGLFNDLDGLSADQMPFDVTLTGVDSEVPVGESVTVNYSVENTGDSEDTQDIALTVDGSVVDTAPDVTLASGATTDGQFSYEAGAEDAPGIGVGVSSETDVSTAAVGVSTTAFFAVNITDVDETVTAGETVTADYEVTNTGGVEATQTVEFAVDGTVQSTEPVTLGGEETFTGQFGYDTVTGDTPDIDLSVTSANDSVTETVTVLAPAAFAVNITNVDESVVAGESVTVDYSVENTGDIEATQDITFTVDGTTEGTEADLTLGSGETFGSTFSYDAVAGDTPGVDIAVASDDDAATANVTVLEPATFAVTLTSVDDEVVEGETTTVAYEVTNTGEAEATQDITFAVNGTTEGTEPGVTLNGSETFSGQFTYETAAGDAPAVVVAVSSGDDAATANVTVLEPPSFAVTITGIDEEVAAGTELTVDYSVENTGDAAGTQDITFAVNGSTEATETGVTLGGGETVSDAFVYTTGTSDVPAVSVSVSSADDSDTATAPVVEADIFAVAIDSVNESVIEGETITVAYNITNTGDAESTQDITFAVDGTLEGTEPSVTLGGGESFAGQFTYATGSEDVPGVAVAVASDNDTADRTVPVNEPPFFDVTVSGVDDPVAAGETVTVDYSVENTGGAEVTQDITLAVNGTIEGTETDVTLDGSETFDGQFTYDTDGGDTPAVNLAVASDDDTATANVTVLEPAVFDVTLTALDDAVTAGETVTVEYAVENTGEAQDTQDITLAVNGSVEATEAGVTLNGSETFGGQFTYETTADDTPAVAVAVSSADGSATGTVVVNEPAFFDVTLTDIESAVLEGETVTAEYEVTNTGDIEATQDITFAVNGTAEDTVPDVTLGAGATFTGQFTYDTVTGDAPAVAVALASNNDTATETVTVDTPATFAVSITAVDDAVTAGETVTVDYSVENTGTLEDTQDITLAVNGTVEATEADVALGGGATFTGQFTYDTVAGDAPAVAVTVGSDNNTAAETVTVLEPAAFAVSITAVDDAVTAGETVTVDYTVENTGDAEGTQDITLAVDGTVEATEPDVTLGGGATFTGQFTYVTGEGDVPDIDATVASADDTVTETVTVNEPAFFDVTLTDINGTVTEGETVVVEYSVENTGDVTDTQTIEFTVNGTTEDTNASVELAGGDTTSGQFTYETSEGDAPAVAAGVTSEDDTETATVTVNEPALFNVTLTDADDGVTEGETITVNYTVVNTGDVTDTQDITFAVNGTVESTRSGLTLAGGDTASGQFTYETSIGDSPAKLVTVASADTEATETVTVLETDPDIIASLSTEEGTVGDTVGVDLDIVTFDGQGDPFDSYQLDISFDQSVLAFQNITAGGWGEPSAVDSSNGTVAVADFAPSGETPVEPALTLNFEIVGQGGSAVEFTNEVNQNSINGPDGEYQTKYEDGAAGTSVSNAVSGLSDGGVRIRTDRERTPARETDHVLAD
jgi:hypothetical protein